MKNLDKIFKAYDIRGVYPKEINEKVGYSIGRAAARFLNLEMQDKHFKMRTQGIEEMVVGYDGRDSSESLAKALIKGIQDEGVDVIDIGLTTTPMFCFSAVEWKLKGGIMITASHNPPEYNGFKIIRDKAMPVGKNSGLFKIKGMVEKLNRNVKTKRGELEKRQPLDDYIKHILEFVHEENIRDLKIVADISDSTAGLIIPELFDHIPSEVVFGNIRSVQKKVLSEKADLGVSFDGDGDRILFVDEKGERIGPDIIAAVLIHYYFKNAGKILYTAVSSRNLKQEIEDTNNASVVSKVGHTFMKELMEKENTAFGCEPSGHYYFKSNNSVESPFVALLKVLEIISKTKMPLSEITREFQEYYEEKINIKVQASGIMRKLEQEYKKNGKVSRIDGLTIEFPDWWFNLRASNTEPVFRFTLEARTKELLKEKKKEINRLIKLN